MAQSGYPLPAYPPVSQPSTSDQKGQSVYPPNPPVGYPLVSQPNYTQEPQPAGYPNTAPPAAYPTVSQPVHEQGYHAASPMTYPPVSQPYNSHAHNTVQHGYQTAPPMTNNPPASQPYNAYAPQPGYATVPQAAGYPQVSQQTNALPVAAVPAPTPQPNYNAITNPLPVLGPQYCLPHLVDLAVTRKLMTLTDDFVVTDVNKNVMFKIKGKFFSLHDKRVLLDSTGKPVLTLRQKILTAHRRWLAYRGGSSDSRDLLFTAKTSSVIQLKTNLNVYLANRTSEDVSDFRVQGSWSERSCMIYVGESQTIAAQMREKESAESFFLGKDTFMITIYPNVDYAFIVALIVILDAINATDEV